MENDFNLDRLFEQARSTEPEVSFNETRKAFLTSLALSAGGVLATKGVLKLFTSQKWIIMLSSITVISTTAVLSMMAITAEDDVKPEQGNLYPVNPITNIETQKPLAELITGDKETTKPLVYTGEKTSVELLPKPELSSLAFTPIPSHNLVYYIDDTLNDKKENTSKNVITPYSERFEITESTTLEDLEFLKTQAEAAGIKFSYKASLKKDKLQSLTISAKISERNNQQSMQISRDDFSEDKEPIIFGWYASKSGKAESMGYGDEKNIKCNTDKSIRCGENRTGYVDDLPEFMDEAEIRIADLLAKIDDLDFKLELEVGGVMENLEMEFKDLERYLNENLLDIELDELLELKDMTGLLEDVETLNAELIEELEQEINELIEEIEELKKTKQEKE